MPNPGIAYKFLILGLILLETGISGTETFSQSSYSIAFIGFQSPLKSLTSNCDLKNGLQPKILQIVIPLLPIWGY